ncbi:Decarboxylase [Pleurostoma richardsiae]|uniref:Decarboxylase n=1 Tax=Pleurostoma richardsiae TaxID=41990 RepID=A0AA38S2H5_9PEZI|nr:Decarboxylase [Pleurostoma richardsiae]
MSAFKAESWTWYAITWLVVAARMVSRVLLRGTWKKLQSDDALMMFAMATDTVLMVSINIVATTSSNLIDPNDPTPLTPENIKERVFGSKMVLVVEQMQILTTWSVKCCLLIMYNRLTMSLRHNLAVKIVAGYVAVGFVVMEILYLGVWCRPFSEYWAVPPDNGIPFVQCSAATNHLITNAVLNISSDIMIILIPMPLLINSQILPKKKAMLFGVFAIGAFTILSAILNKFYSFNDPFGTDWVFWYIRESSTALICANLAHIWTLLRRVLHLKSFIEKSSNQRSGPASGFRSNFSRAQGSVGRDEVSLERSGSQDWINRDDSIPLKIYQRQEVEVRTYAVGSDDEHVSSSGAPSTTKVTFHSGSRDEETASEASTGGIVKVTHGI